MSIYKVNHIIGSVKSIHVFYGTVNLDKQEYAIDQLFQQALQEDSDFLDPKTKTVIFTREELDEIKSQSISVIFSKQQIHYDDSIGVIKMKIMHEMNYAFSLQEIYLFFQQEDVLQSGNIYQTLTQNNKLRINRVRFDQFLKNILDENGNPVEFNIPEKEYYDYSDVLQLNVDNGSFLVNKALGQRFFIVENEYPFVVNPFEASEYDPFIERASRKSLTTLNSHLLLSSGPIKNNNIYLCLAGDVLEKIEDEQMREYTLKIYYYQLYSKNIHSLAELETNRLSLIDESKKTVTPAVLESFASIDLFYDMYRYRKTNLAYKSQGIKSVKAILHPEFTMKIPLEVIFKLIHATELTPLIKYNPSTRQEKMYRLYANKVAVDGRKIPFLSKASIFKLMRTIGKNKCVSIYIDYMHEKTLISLVCEFEENGDITIASTFNSILDMDTINIIFRNSVNPIIEEIKSYLEQSGYSIELFDSIDHKSVEIKQLEYETSIEVSVPFNLKDLRGCISSIFIVESDNFNSKSDMKLRFKRVANFNKKTSQDAFLLEKQAQGFYGDALVNELIKNFEGITRKDANEMVMKLASELELERGAKKRDIEIKINPGFQVTISQKQFTKDVVFTVQSINSVQYLKTIPIYIDSFIRLTQNKLSTLIPLKNITRLCIGQEKPEISVPDIVSVSEKSISDQEIPVLENDDLIYMALDESDGSNDELKTAMDMFYGDEEEEEEEESKLSGGVSSGDLKSSNEISLPELSQRQSGDDSLSTLGSNLSDVEVIGEPDEAVNSGLERELLPSSLSSNLSDVEVVGQEEDLDQGAIPSAESEDLNQGAIPSAVEEEEEDLNRGAIPSAQSEDLNRGAIPSAESEDLIEEQSIPSAQSEDLIEEQAIPSAVEQDLDKESPLTSRPKTPQLSSSGESIALRENPTQVQSLERSVEGLPLAYPYYFQERIEQLDPVLVLKKKQGRYNAYSRICDSSAKRIPVILTQEELDRINRENNGFLKESDVVKYGSNPDKQFYYICPRFWNLNTNTVITEKEIQEKNLFDKIIPDKINGKKVTRVPAGKYIYQFKTTKQYPGFVKLDTHPGITGPDGKKKEICLPCCFSAWNTDGLVKRRQKCMNTELDEGSKDKEEDFGDKDDYVKGPEKFPLARERWGYLPTNIQLLLNEFNSSCQVSKTNTNVKPNHTCFLRHGVENSPTQSFIACISDAIFYTRVDKNRHPMRVSISKMKENIIESLTLDNFIRYQNGNLVNDFSNPERVVDKEKYKETTIYAKAHENENESKMAYFNKICSSFENFIDFLKNETVKIDYTYLWDILCEASEYLFKNGVNLIIMSIPDDDVTNNLNFICPTNHYSGKFYDDRKPTLFLLKRGDYYEPLYSYRYDTTKTSVPTTFVGKLFSEFDANLSPVIKDLFKNVVKPYYQGSDGIQSLCRPESSLSKKAYPATHAIELSKLISVLEKYSYTIVKQVLNYNNKVIGIIAKEKEKSGFVPCYPSSINPDYEYVFMVENGLWKNYSETLYFLTQLYKKTRGEIPCSISFLVVEDKMVIGILTETNQMVQLSEPYPVSSVREEFPFMESSSELQVDETISTTSKMDKERLTYVNNIKLETNFFNAFRTTVRLLMNSFENNDIRERILSVSRDPSILYNKKLSYIDKLLRQLVERKLSISFLDDVSLFQNYDEYVDTTAVNTCIINKNKDKCVKMCKYVEESQTCQLVLPMRNLIQPRSNNEKYYYARMADELIRYSRIKSFIFQPQVYLSFSNVGYNLRDNEIIILESLLTQEYFDNLIAAPLNRYVSYNSYDNVKPIESLYYKNAVDLNNPTKSVGIPLVEEPKLLAPLGQDLSPLGQDLSPLDQDLSPLDQDLSPLDQDLFPLDEDLPDKSCGTPQQTKIKSLLWRKCFPPHIQELEYPKTKSCTLDIIIDLVKEKLKKTLTPSSIKKTLYEIYKTYIPNYENQIIDILREEGKKNIMDRVKAKMLTLVSTIINDEYFLTTLDYWLLVTYYKIPCLFISTTFLFETGHKYREFIGYGNNVEEEFAIIIVPGLRQNIVPSFRLIQNTETSSLFLRLAELKPCSGKEALTDCFSRISTVEDYIKTYTHVSKTVYKKKRPQLLIIEDSEPTEEELPLLQDKALPAVQASSGDKPLSRKPSTKKIYQKKTTAPKTRRVLAIEPSSNSD